MWIYLLWLDFKMEQKTLVQNNLFCIYCQNNLKVKSIKSNLLLHLQCITCKKDQMIYKDDYDKLRKLS